jgi:hypothetical protein
MIIHNAQPINAQSMHHAQRMNERRPTHRTTPREQPWIKTVLAEMQESVENHISSAMKNGH